MTDFNKLFANLKKEHKKLDTTIQDLNELDNEVLSTGHRIAEKVVATIGSWKFIIIQTVLIWFWATLNVIAWIQHWDPYPFILLNLFLSIQAAYAAPIIMMAQNRQSARDRLDAHNDFLINVKAEQEIHMIIDQLKIQQGSIQEIHRLLSELKKNK